MYALAAAQSSAGSTVGIIVAIAGFLAYWIPSLTAAIRHVPSTGSVIVINLFLGWTVIGWIVALAMACRSKPPPYRQPAPGYYQPGYYPPAQQGPRQ